MISASPRIGLPIGWPGKAAAWNASKITSSGMSAASPISCVMTTRSRVSSASSNTEFCRISAMMSTATATSALSTEA